MATIYATTNRTLTTQLPSADERAHNPKARRLARHEVYLACRIIDAMELNYHCSPETLNQLIRYMEFMGGNEKRLPSLVRKFNAPPSGIDESLWRKMVGLYVAYEFKRDLDHENEPLWEECMAEAHRDFDRDDFTATFAN